MNRDLGRCVRLSTCLCLWMIGCSSGDLEEAPWAESTASPVQAIEAAARISIEHTRGRVIMSDPLRRARAYENGLVGRPRPEVVESKSRPTAQAAACDLPPGEPATRPRPWRP